MLIPSKRALTLTVSIKKRKKLRDQIASSEIVSTIDSCVELAGQLVDATEIDTVKRKKWVIPSQVAVPTLNQLTVPFEKPDSKLNEVVYFTELKKVESPIESRQKPKKIQ